MTLKGIVHCHTVLSYDGEVALTDLCRVLRQHGFGFVALTEHPRGLTAARYEEFVQQCRAASDTSFVVIPGLEFRCADGVDIAGVGVTSWLDEDTPDQVVADIRAHGGFSIWVHPWRNRSSDARFVDCDAVEILNQRVDGTLAPNLRLLRRTVHERNAGRHCHAIVGADFHDLSQPFSTWVECRVSEASANAVVTSLRDGSFVNRVPYATVTSSGAAGPVDYAVMAAFRSSYLVWRGILNNVPRPVKRWLVVLSRPILGVLRRDRTSLKIG